jgi:tetratricopeptide (TPR) repeat protein
MKLIWLYEKTLSPMKVHRFKAQAYAQSDQYDKAISELTLALKIDPNAIDLLYKRSALFRAQGKTQEALGDCNKLLSMKANIPERLRERASIYVDLKRYDEALNDLKTAGNLPNNPGALRDGIVLSRKLGRHKEVIEFTSKAIAMMPEEESAYVSRAESYIALGRNREALADLEKAHNLDLSDSKIISDLRAKALKGTSFTKTAAITMPKGRAIRNAQEAHGQKK